MELCWAPQRRWSELESLRHIFGRGGNGAWLQFCAEIGAALTKGRSGQSDRVVAQFKKWTIALDSFVVAVPGGASAIYTRMRVPYINRDGFRFRVYSKKLPYKIKEKLLGIYSVMVGDPDFDRRFVIEGNDKSEIRTLFASPRIRQLIQFQPSINLEVRHDRDGLEPCLPDGVDQLYFHESGIIRDVERLKSLYDLFAEILDHLCCMGFAAEDKPDFAL